MRSAGSVLLASLVLAACATPPAANETAPAASSVAPSVTSEPSERETAGPSSAASEPLPAAEWAMLGATGPQPREDHTWTVDAAGGAAYLFGGRDGAAVYADLWRYDLATDAWSELTVDGGPPARFGHEAVWVEGTGLVVFAGQAGADFFNDLWAIDPATGSWRELPSGGDVPVARYGTCGAIGLDGRLWISHGFTSERARFNDTLAYDFGSGTWSDETPEAPLPVNRCLHGCWWTHAGELALFGGQTTGAIALGDLWLLADGAWTRVDGTLPAARNLYAPVRLESATLGFGGQALDESYLADAFLFRDGEADAVAVDVVGTRPAPRAAAAMIHDAERNRILMFGGRDAETAYGDVWELRNVVGS